MHVLYMLALYSTLYYACMNSLRVRTHSRTKKTLCGTTGERRYFTYVARRQARAHNAQQSSTHSLHARQDKQQTRNCSPWDSQWHCNTSRSGPLATESNKGKTNMAIQTGLQYWMCVRWAEEKTIGSKQKADENCCRLLQWPQSGERTGPSNRSNNHEDRL